MTRTEIESKLLEIISPYLGEGASLDGVSAETDLLRDLKINSAHLVDVILDAEEVFDIEIDDESAEKMLTVGNAIDIIEQKLA